MSPALLMPQKCSSGWCADSQPRGRGTSCSLTGDDRAGRARGRANSAGQQAGLTACLCPQRGPWAAGHPHLVLCGASTQAPREPSGPSGGRPWLREVGSKASCCDEWIHTVVGGGGTVFSVSPGCRGCAVAPSLGTRARPCPCLADPSLGPLGTPCWCSGGLSAPTLPVPIPRCSSVQVTSRTEPLAQLGGLTFLISEHVFAVTHGDSPVKGKPSVRIYTKSTHH